MAKTLIGKSVTLKINTAAMKAVINTFSPGSNLQKFVDMEVIRLSDKFAPSDTTALRKSPFIRTNFGSGQVIYEIYGNKDGRNTWNDTTSLFQDRPMRGPFWVERTMNSGGREKLLLAIDKFRGR